MDHAKRITTSRSATPPNDAVHGPGNDGLRGTVAYGRSVRTVNLPRLVCFASSSCLSLGWQTCWEIVGSQEVTRVGVKSGC